MFSFPLLAQTDRAAITGIVSDPSQGVIPSAKVVVRAIAQGLDYTTETNATGAYTISSLPIGEYMMSVDAKGFEPLRIETFTLVPVRS